MIRSPEQEAPVRWTADRKVATVTGGSEGLGRATADRLAEEGPRVAICARRLLHAVADRARWQAALNEARRRAVSGDREPDTTGVAA